MHDEAKPAVCSEITEPIPGADNYTIGREIARGGMGSILEAEDTKLQRAVAIKVMLLDADDDATMRRRFLREAKVLAALAHPNIVPIYDIVWEDGAPLFCSMKLVKGRTLQAILNDLSKGEPKTRIEYTLDRLLLIFRKICDGIAFAHSKGILHRDLKPENVMVGEFGEVMVMDWGLAKWMEDRAEPKRDSLPSRDVDPWQFSGTLQGAVLGTPQYMSPEQATGRIDELDERSDIFSLGGILYAILTLRPPVKGQPVPETLAKVTCGQITPPQEWSCSSTRAMNEVAFPISATGNRVPPALAAVTMKALQHNPGQRYPSVAALGADIDAWQNGFATSAEEAGAMTQLKLVVLRHKTVTAALAVLLALSLGFVLKLMASERIAERNAVEARAAESVAIKEKETARRALARSQISLAEAAYRESDGSAMLTVLDTVPPDLRGSDWRYLHSRADTSQAQVIFPPGVWFGGVAAHPRQPGVFAAASQEHTIAMTEAKTGRSLSEFPLSARQSRFPHYRSVDFSPDGDRIIVGGLNAAGVGIYDARSGRCLVEWDGFDTALVRFNREGDRTLDVSSEHEMKVRDAATGRLLWSSRSVPCALFTPSGDVISAKFDYPRVLSGDSGEVLRELPRFPGPIMDMALSPDGETLFVVIHTGKVHGVKVADGSSVFERQLTERGGPARIALGSGGRTVVAASARQDGFRTVRAWDSKTGTLLASLLGGGGMIEGFAVHPLSDDVIVTGPDTRTWSLGTKVPVWSMDDEINARVVEFWNAEDVILSGSGVTQLPRNGEGSRLLWDPPEELRGSLRGAVGGDFAVAGKEYPNASRIVVLRKADDTISVLHALRTTTGLEKIRMSEAGERFAAANPYNEMDVFDTSNGTRLARCDPADLATITDVRWVGTERLVGIGIHGVRGQPGSEDRVVLWDSATGQVLGKRRSPVLNCLAVAPDQRRFATGGPEKLVRVCDAQTLEVLSEFRAHDGPVEALAFHPSKPILVSASADLTIRFWNLEDGRLIEQLRPSASEPKLLHFSPSGKRLISRDSGGTLRAWDIDALPETDLLKQGES